MSMQNAKPKMKIKPPGYWTIGRVSEVAKRYDSRVRFQRGHNTAYVIAFRRGWLASVCAHMLPAGSIIRRYVYRIWREETKEVYVGIACDWRRRYSLHKSVPKASMITFMSQPHEVEPITPLPIDAKEAAAMECAEIERYRREGWRVLNVAKGGGLGGGKTLWTKEALMDLAKQYPTRRALRAANNSAYVIASRQRLLDAMFSDHLNKGLAPDRMKNGTWTHEQLHEEAKRFRTRKQMATSSAGAYLAAHKSGILDEIFRDHENSGLTKGWQTRRRRKFT